MRKLLNKVKSAIGGRNEFNKIIGLIGMVALLVGILDPLARPATVNATTTWNVGDVFVGVSSGSYQVYDNNGVFKESINDGLGGGAFDFTTGCAFNNSLDKLYTTYFGQTKVKVYDDATPHTLSQTIDTAVNSPVGHSESIVFAANGDFFVGHPDGNDDIHRYDSAGVFQQAYDVPIQSRGSDWMDLAANQQTMFYTSEGGRIMRYDVSLDVALPDFANIGGISYALRLLSPGDGSGGLLVANSTDIKRLNAAGAVIQTYDAPGENQWFALNLDPNGTSFWSGDLTSANFYRFNISTGAIEVGPINTGTGFNTLAGICVKGEPTAAASPEITLDPPTDTNAAGENHTVTATVTQGGQPVVGTQISFSVIAGPNSGQVSDPGECIIDPNCNTDANGQTSWTYTSDGTVGTDTIQACFTDEQGDEHCAQAEKEWVDREPPQVACVETVNPHGKNVPPAGSTTLPGSRGGQNEDGFYEFLAKDLSGIAGIFATDAGGAGPFGAFASGDKVKITEAPGAVPSSKPMGSSNGQAGAIVAHITLNGDALVYAVDGAGNVSDPITCFVPPPPK